MHLYSFVPLWRMTSPSIRLALSRVFEFPHAQSPG
jgi:hypothetical protein